MDVDGGWRTVLVGRASPVCASVPNPNSTFWRPAPIVPTNGPLFWSLLCSPLLSSRLLGSTNADRPSRPSIHPSTTSATPVHGPARF